MKYAVQMGLSVMMYIPNFAKIGSGIWKLIGSGIHRQNAERINLLSFIQNKESRVTKTHTYLMVFGVCG
jgi:hypothetical protein